MAFPPQFLEELRARLPLAGVIGRKVKLQRRGREYLGLCPFHNERTPSFTVNEEKGFYHCFGCGAHGDVVGFEMQAHHLSFPEAVERLAAEAGVTPPAQTPRERERAKRQASLYDACEAACAYFEQQLRSAAGRDALAYLRGRGLDEAIIARFRLGFAADGRDGLKAALKAAGLPEALLVEAGLLIRRDDGSTYDRFRGRVIFPISDRRGRIVAFGGRILGDGQPKYLNSPDTPLFHKGSLLYGLAQARLPAAEAGTVIAVEGYMDVIALSRAGLANAVAPLGTALTEQQIEAMWRMAPEPILCLDGDAAGQRAAARAALRALPLLKPGQSLRFAMLPAPEDPDSLISARGADAMRAVLDRAEPLFEVLWRMLVSAKPLDTPERRAAAEREFRDSVAVIAEPMVRKQYEAEGLARLRSLFAAQRWQRRSGRGRAPTTSVGRGEDGRIAALGAARPQAMPSSSSEALMLFLVVRRPEIFAAVAERLGAVQFANGEAEALRQRLMGCLDAGDEAVAALLDEPRFARYFGQMAQLQANVFVLRRDVDDVVRLWEDAYQRHLRPEIDADCARIEAELGTEPSLERLDRLLALQEAKRGLDDTDG